MADPTETYIKALTDLLARIGILESRVDKQEMLLAQTSEKMTNLQTGIDKINERMVFVDKLENMDSSITMLVKMARGLVFFVGTLAAMYAAFKAGDIATMKELIGAFAP